MAQRITATGLIGMTAAFAQPDVAVRTALLGIGSFGMIAQLHDARIRLGTSGTHRHAAIQHDYILNDLWGEIFWREHISLSGFIGMALVMIAGLSATLYSLKHKQ